MKICVFGAGAIGGNFAARLADAGNEVSVVARGAHLEAIRAKGLTLIAGDKKIVAKVKASDKPADLGKQDVVISTLKANGLPALAESVEIRCSAPRPAWCSRRTASPGGTDAASTARGRRHPTCRGSIPAARLPRPWATSVPWAAPSPRPTTWSKPGVINNEQPDRNTALGRRDRRQANAAHRGAPQGADRRRHRLALEQGHPLRHLAQAHGQLSPARRWP